VKVQAAGKGKSARGIMRVRVARAMPVNYRRVCRNGLEMRAEARTLVEVRAPVAVDFSVLPVLES
jgi:hypothetical protein